MGTSTPKRTVASGLGPAGRLEPPPGLLAEQVHAGRWLFRRRGYLPIPLVLFLLASTALAPRATGGEAWGRFWLGLGFSLGIGGLLLRGLSVGWVASGTSQRGTEAIRADTLNTTGAYSIVRHPLYLGNFILWLGTAAFVGKPLVLCLTALIFWVYYERIMIAEEFFLHGRFGAAFDTWADRTPALFPSRRASWRPSPHCFSLRHALGRDYPAVYAFVGTTFAIQLVRVSVQQGLSGLTLIWWGYLLSGTGFYLTLRTLKRRTRLLEATDR